MGVFLRSFSSSMEKRHSDAFRAVNFEFRYFDATGESLLPWRDYE